MAKKDDCVFCDESKIRSDDIRVVRGTSTSVDCMIFEPLEPVTDGHALVVPVEHADDLSDSFRLAAGAMEVAAWLCHRFSDVNVITSKGAHATQTVGHLHLHVVPRYAGDGLHLPWTGQHFGDASR